MRHVTTAAWIVAAAAAIWRCVWLITGHAESRADQIVWTILVLGWIGIAWIKDRTIKYQRQQIEAEKQKRQAIWS